MSYDWCNAASQDFMARDYLLPGETVESRVQAIAARAEEILGIPGFAAKFEGYMSAGYYSLSTPVWVNFGTTRGLPISCYGSYVDDTMHGILGTHAEVGMMSKTGGGTSAYFGALRPRGAKIKNNGESSGAVHFMQLFDSVVNIVSQGKTRRGNFAAYMDIDHGDIEEFLAIKSEGHHIQDVSFGVCVSDAWLNEMIAGDTAKRRIWAKVLESRTNTGFPYIQFTDNVNRGAPEVYQHKDYRIRASNLCTEIQLPTNPWESFVCCLSSMNLLHFESWKETDAVETMIFFLDAVMSEFIAKAEHIPFMDKAYTFAKRHRALGLGALGWHSYLQSNMIPFESFQAKMKNAAIFQTMKIQADAASAKLAGMFGEPEMLLGYGRRNTTLLAVAPTKSSSFILGQVSEGIEPERANYYTKDAAKGKYTIKNPYLTALLKTKGMDTPEVWDSILKSGGSVQHLAGLSDDEKAVFKTFAEIAPMEIIIQAAQRQKFIDQAQSINLMIAPTTPVKDVNALILKAWELGVKSLYYQIGVNAAQQFSRDILACSSCEA